MDHLVKKGIFLLARRQAGFGSFYFIACLLLNKGIHEPLRRFIGKQRTEGSWKPIKNNNNHIESKMTKVVIHDLPTHEYRKRKTLYRWDFENYR